MMRAAYDTGFDDGFGFHVTSRAIALPHATRQGDHISDAVTVPDGTQSVCLTADLDTDTRQHVGAAVGVELEAQVGEAWRPVCAFTWEGPTLTDPSVSLPRAVVPGEVVRLVVRVPTEIAVGASLEFV